ncbi:hypothetical protein SAMN04487785_116116 [Dyella jiangningensis]|uniref:hypothetical protein n=1 Tax=Dyella sp. AtDHG13 TaxID=1938897 RepID=UPI00088E596E|nr:hypothetical protein [Dyella sp. AtDHG13]PXV53598.1 hypothetical protein BDW41_1145 [Dyella sp. AtDHG13]SDL24715.1 hypothetical protein SAMN04487785_116116 [Dyella jiangningensis]
MEHDRPVYVTRYMTALSTPAMARWASSDAHRELAKERSLKVINAPWKAEVAQVDISREFGFLRDFWNLFHECIQSCQALDLIREMASDAMDLVKADRHTATVTFWVESYLNEVYIFQSRLLDLITFIQRRYKKDKDFTEFVSEVGDSLAGFVKEQLEALVTDRGAHVHERRHRLTDPELVRLTLLDTMIDVLGDVELNETRDQARKDAATWLSKQLRHASGLVWHLLDEVCRGFSDGILLDNDRIIVPNHLKDDLTAFRNAQANAVPESKAP